MQASTNLFARVDGARDSGPKIGLVCIRKKNEAAGSCGPVAARTTLGWPLTYRYFVLHAIEPDDSWECTGVRDSTVLACLAG